MKMWLDLLLLAAAMLACQLAALTIIGWLYGLL